jgi:hypothetical protein
VQSAERAPDVPRARLDRRSGHLCFALREKTEQLAHRRQGSVVRDRNYGLHSHPNNRTRRAMTGFCKWTLRLLALAYALALAVGLIGTFGWLGQARDPLSWVFVILLGQPWVAWIGDLPDPVRMWVAALAPLLNLFLLAVVCGVITRHRRDFSHTSDEADP